jgi:predicted nucleotidyltransferase
VSSGLEGLPEAAARGAHDFLEVAREALGDSLESAVLFGSAAEGRLRPTSDLNLILVLRGFELDAVDRLREPARVAQATVRLAVLYLRHDEIADAAEAFAAKFADIRRRRLVLFGPDPFASLVIPRDAEIFRLRQVLLNLTLRLRSLYVERSLREEQLVLVVADMAAPLRSAAATLRELEGQAPVAGKEALLAFAATAGSGAWRETLDALSEARETRRLPPGAARRATQGLLELAESLRARVSTLSAQE